MHEKIEKLSDFENIIYIHIYHFGATQKIGFGSGTDEVLIRWESKGTKPKGTSQKGPAKRDQPKGTNTQKGPWPKGTMTKRDHGQKGPCTKYVLSMY